MVKKEKPIFMYMYVCGMHIILTIKKAWDWTGMQDI